MQVLQRTYEEVVNSAPFDILKAVLISANNQRFSLAKTFIRTSGLKDTEVNHEHGKPTFLENHEGNSSWVKNQCVLLFQWSKLSCIFDSLLSYVVLYIVR